MVALHISEELAGTISEEAATRGISVEEYLRSAIKRARTLNARQKIEQDQAWWLALPLSKRAKYEGEFILIYTKKWEESNGKRTASKRNKGFAIFKADFDFNSFYCNFSGLGFI